MKFFISKITGRLITAFQQAKTESKYNDITAVILPSGGVVELYSTTRYDDILIEIESCIVTN